ncbi:MAG: hypothetical protein EAX96_19465 [Candidatus Lokiarchaeota archaeon]|nr:hypothetical protein [Candidatus Lokiarchaeota archaeon]
MKMRVIPVLDILTIDGKKQVVRGIKGERKKYRPIRSSKILNDSSPIKMAQKFKELADFNELYIADLDAIQGINKELEYINNITKKLDYKIMLDAGISSLSDIEALKYLNIDKLIIGTETLKDINELKNITKVLGKSKVILSIDLLNGQLLTRNEKFKSQTLNEFLKLIERININEIIFLELTQVGSKRGINKKLIDIMKDNLKNTKLITGGGVKTIQDLSSMQELGINGALIATAFHEGTITIKEIKEFQFNNT